MGSAQADNRLCLVMQVCQRVAALVWFLSLGADGVEIGPLLADLAGHGAGGFQVERRPSLLVFFQEVFTVHVDRQRLSGKSVVGHPSITRVPVLCPVVSGAAGSLADDQFVCWSAVKL